MAVKGMWMKGWGAVMPWLQHFTACYNMLQPYTTTDLYLEHISKKRAEILGRDLNPKLGT